MPFLEKSSMGIPVEDRGRLSGVGERTQITFGKRRDTWPRWKGQRMGHPGDSLLQGFPLLPLSPPGNICQPTPCSEEVGGDTPGKGVRS